MTRDEAGADVWGGSPPDAVRARGARHLRVMAHPVRLQLLERLSRAPYAATVGQLADQVGIPLESASKHLRALAAEGLLTFRRDGGHRRYALADRDHARIGALAYRAVVSEIARVRAALEE